MKGSPAGCYWNLIFSFIIHFKDSLFQKNRFQLKVNCVRNLFCKRFLNFEKLLCLMLISNNLLDFNLNCRYTVIFLGSIKTFLISFIKGFLLLDPIQYDIDISKGKFSPTIMIQGLQQPTRTQKLANRQVLTLIESTPSLVNRTHH